MHSLNFLRICLSSTAACICIALVSGSPGLQLGKQSGFEDIFPEELFKPRAFEAEPRFRLPVTVDPSNYKLDIRPILKDGLVGDDLEFTAPGHVQISVKCVAVGNTITLHSESIVWEELKISVLSTGDNVPFARTVPDASTSSVRIELEENLALNLEYLIDITFTAEVNDGLYGLYRSSHVDTETGEVTYIATTQFESTGARLAFPCFDEPAFRATFDIRIGRPDGGIYHSLSNTHHFGDPIPIDGVAGWVWDTFARTVEMPTYLVAIVVSDFTSEDAPAGLFRTDVRTWGPKSLMGEDNANAKFSAAVAAKLLKHFEDYFDSLYQLEKLDSVAIPNFAAGAMENWGLNTYRVPLMLFFEGDSTQFEQWRQAAVISHEVSHHWFGNLVTMTWWNDLWLKEGFARYLQFFGVQTAEPQLEALNRFILDTIQVAMEHDIGPNTHPLRSLVTDQMPSQNSRIIYEKGASIIRTMQGFLTEEVLKESMRNYLVDFAYGSVVQDQLFEILTKVAHEKGTLPSDVTVKSIMDTWTLQDGYPLIRVSKAGNIRIFLSQEKFYANAIPKDENLKQLWQVPVTYATASNPDFESTNWTPKLWIDKNVLITSHSVAATSEWLIVNPDARSYYRVLYDDHYAGLLKAQLDADHTKISDSSRSQLFDDYFVSAYNSYAKIESALQFTTFLDKERTLVVWTTFFNHMRKPYALLSQTELLTPFKNYILSKVEPALVTIGLIQVPSEPPIRTMLRAQYLDWGCSLGNQLCYETATTLIKAWIADATARIPADVQPMMFCAAVAASNGDAETKAFILVQYQKSTTTVRQKGLLLNALACGLTDILLQDALDMAIDAASGIALPKDGITLIQKVAENTAGRELAFKFLTDKKAEIISALGEGAFRSVIGTLANYYGSEAEAVKIETFITDNDDLSEPVKAALRNSAATVRTNAIWNGKHKEGFQKFFSSLNPNPKD